MWLLMSAESDRLRGVALLDPSCLLLPTVVLHKEASKFSRGVGGDRSVADRRLWLHEMTLMMLGDALSAVSASGRDTADCL
jgi:hypothetical protein